MFTQVCYLCIEDKQSLRGELSHALQCHKVGIFVRHKQDLNVAKRTTCVL